MKPSLLLSALLLSTKAFAQQDAVLDSVTVRENRLPGSAASQNRNIQILTAAQLALLPVKSTAELLGYLAGADLRQRAPWGGQADLSLDGSTGEAVLVLVNGVKMSDPQTGHHLMNLPIPLSAIDHIEVLHGPAARVYGLNALAGAVNIVTRLPRQNEAALQTYAGGGFQRDSSGTLYAGAGGQFSAGFHGKATAQLLSLAYDRANGYRYNTAYAGTRIFYQSSTRLSRKAALEAMGGYLSSDFGASLFYNAPYDKEAVEGVRTVLGSVAVPVQTSGRLRITPRLSYRYKHDDYIYLRANPEYYHNIHETSVVTGEVQGSLKLGKGTLGAGAELRGETIRSSNLGEHRRSNTGVYLEYRHAFSEKLSAGAGLYFNHNSDWGPQLFPGADIGYRLSRSLRLFGSISTGARLPTYTDLYYRGPGNIGNPALRPENAAGGNAGIVFGRKAFRAQLSGFYRRTSGLIDFVRPLDTAVKVYQPQNFQDVNTAGYSLRLDCNLGRALAWRERYGLTAGLSYSYLDLSLRQPYEAMTRYTLQALRHQLIVQVSATAGRFTLNVQGRYLERFSYHDYFLLDARLACSFRHLDLYADGSNLLDQQYVEAGAVPMPGRWLTLGLRARLAGNQE